MEDVYQEIIKSKDDAESQVCLKTIENFTKILTNFAKYGYALH